MPTTSELSWNKTSFPAKLSLFLRSRREESLRINSVDASFRANGYSALSSTYYSIVGTAMAKLVACVQPTNKWLLPLAPFRLLMWMFSWGLLGSWCFLRMLPLSDKVCEILGNENMSPQQADIRQNILRRAKFYTEAELCIKSALKKNPECNHTCGLLHAGLAEVYVRQGNLSGAEAEVYEAIIYAHLAELTDQRQASRIYRLCASVRDRIDGRTTKLTNSMRERALELASAAGAKDQLLKQS